MNLKLALSEKEWSYIIGLKRLEVMYEDMDEESYREYIRAVREEEHENNKSILMFVAENILHKEKKEELKLINVETITGERYIIATEKEVYLMNNEGQTVERI